MSTIIQIGDKVRVDIMNILDITPIIEPNTHKFDDSEDSGCDEKEWMHRYYITTEKKTYCITEYDLKDLNHLKETHTKLMSLWINNNNNVIIL